MYGWISVWLAVFIEPSLCLFIESEIQNFEWWWLLVHTFFLRETLFLIFPSTVLQLKAFQLIHQTRRSRWTTLWESRDLTPTYKIWDAAHLEKWIVGCFPKCDLANNQEIKSKCSKKIDFFSRNSYYPLAHLLFLFSPALKQPYCLLELVQTLQNAASCVGLISCKETANC